MAGTFSKSPRLQAAILFALFSVALFAVVALPAGAQQSPTATASATPSVPLVTVREIEVRTGPGVAYPLLMVLAPQTELAITAIYQDGSWLVVTLPDDSTGWIRYIPNALQFSLTDFETLPTVGTPTPTIMPTSNPTNLETSAPAATESLDAATATQTLAQTGTPLAVPTLAATSALAFQPFLRANRQIDVYAEPSADADVVQTLSRDMTATVIGTTGDRAWVQILLEHDVTGWVAVEPASITVLGGVASLPVTDGSGAPAATVEASATTLPTQPASPTSIPTTVEASATASPTQVEATAISTTAATATLVETTVLPSATVTSGITASPTLTESPTALATTAVPSATTLPTLTASPTPISSITSSPTASPTLTESPTVPPTATLAPPETEAATAEATSSAIKPTTVPNETVELIGIVAGNDQPKVLRTAPSTDADMIFLVRRGTEVVILGEKPGLQSSPNVPWYNVMLPDGTIGWLRSDTVEVVGVPTPNANIVATLPGTPTPNATLVVETVTPEATVDSGTSTATPTATPGFIGTGTLIPTVDWAANTRLIVINPDGVWLREQPASNALTATLAFNNAVTTTGNFTFVFDQWWWEVRADWGAVGWVEQTSLGMP